MDHLSLTIQPGSGLDYTEGKMRPRECCSVVVAASLAELWLCWIERAAANTAMSGIARMAEDESTDAINDSGIGGTSATAEDEAFDPASNGKLSKKKKKDKIQQAAENGFALTSPLSRFEALPHEITVKILRQLDPHTILNLLTLSKAWHHIMTVGDAMDREWRFFCEEMGSQRRSAGCKTWHETWLSVIRRRCLCCGDDSTAQFGLIWPEGPDWTVICTYCQVNDPYFAVVSEKFALHTMGAEHSDLDSLPFKWRTDSSNSSYGRNKHWYKQYWRKAVVASIEKGRAIRARKEEEEAAAAKIEEEKRIAAAEAAHQERLAKFDAKVAGFSGSVPPLRNAVRAARDSAYPASPKLIKMYENALENDADDIEEELEGIVEYHKSIKAMHKTINAAMKKAGLDAQDHVIPLDELVDKKNSRARKVWIDGLISKSVSIKAYIEAAQEETASMLTGEAVQGGDSEVTQAE